MQVRKPVAQLARGDFVVRIGKNEVGQRFDRTEPIAEGRGVSGPRGGRYVVTAAGAQDLVVVVAGGRRPVCLPTATAVVEVMDR